MSCICLLGLPYNMPQTGGLNSRNLLFSQLEARSESKIEVLAGLVLSEGRKGRTCLASLLGLQACRLVDPLAVLSLCGHSSVHVDPWSLCVFMFPLRQSNQIGSGLSLTSSLQVNHHFKVPFSKKKKRKRKRKLKSLSTNTVTC